MNKHYLLRDVARLLKVKPYQIAYALSVGLVEEPQLRISNKRVFQEEDVHRLAAHFGVDLGKKERKSHDA
jgi:DNA-binding transcriptional MerR regulator